MLGINTNVASLNAQRNLSSSQANMANSVQRLSSGLRVSSAADDAAGMAIATRMDSQIRGSSVALRNTNDGISMMQTADGAMSSIGDDLQRMRELAVQAKNSTSSNDLTSLDKEYQDLGSEINRVINQTDFNGASILKDGTAKTFQVGAKNTDTISVTISDLSAATNLTATTGGSLTSAANAATAITSIDGAIGEINTERANVGSVTNRFNQVASNLQTYNQNMSTARSRIVDADYAAESANMTRNSVLQQAGTAMLAQANAQPNQVLSLLRG